MKMELCNPDSRARLALLSGLIVLGACASEEASAPRRQSPHILLIVADDLGWNDVGYHGSEVHTPTLDRLAKAGVQLENFYVQPYCSPTRSSLLTGRYPFRQGLQLGVARPWMSHGLPLEERTLADGLREVGYRTAIVGKWHLGWSQVGYLPRQRGFDHQYGSYLGGLDYFRHRRMEGLDWHRNGKDLEEEGYATDLFAAEAIRLVREQPEEQPLFLYLPFTAPHGPLQVPPQWRERYRSLPDAKRAVFAAMVTCLDDAIGRVVAAFDERGWLEDTLIVFTSDNGGSARTGGSNQPLRGGKGVAYEGGVRVPAFVHWQGRLKAGARIETPLHAVDWYPTLLTLAGASLEQPLAIDGLDLGALLFEAAPIERGEIPLSVQPGGEGAIRAQNWKLIKSRSQGRERIELFDLAADPAERRNLAAEQPARVFALSERLDRYAAEAAPPLGSRDGRIPEGFVAPPVWRPPQP